MTISGEIDGNTARRLRRLVPPAGDVTVDLSEVSFFGCAGLTYLLRLRDRVHETGATLRLTAIPPLVARVIGLAGLGDVLVEDTADPGAEHSGTVDGCGPCAPGGARVVEA